MVGQLRWKQAQAYERRYWEQYAQRIAEGSIPQMDWYQWRADQLVSRLQALGLGRFTDGTARVVEVGSGPIGIIGFFPAADRAAVDPLEPFYGSNPVLAALRNPAVRYLPGSGEAVPADSQRWDLAIIENCIDHVRDMLAVRHELARLLRPGGLLYLTVNCRTPWGFIVHRVLSRLRLDPGHPHTFTPPRVERFLTGGPFRVLSLETASAAEARRADLQAAEARARLKGVLGISEFIASAIAERLAAPLAQA